MARYEHAEALVSLVLALQAPGRGLSIADVQERFSVSRRTAERMRDAAKRLFPDLWWEMGPDGRRYWKLRRGHGNPLISWSLPELLALEWARRAAERHEREEHARALQAMVEKIRASIQAPGREAERQEARWNAGAADTGSRFRAASAAWPQRSPRRDPFDARDGTWPGGCDACEGSPSETDPPRPPSGS